MSKKTLGDYLNPEDDGSFEGNKPGMGGETFQQEANTLQIEKLSQRVTIISVIIPCIIIAILVFVYMDITEKVVDVDQTQADQMAQVSQDLDVKLNALDVRIAKATHALDEKLTALESKRQALENRTAKMSAAKVDLEAMEAALAKLDKRIKANADQDQSTIAAMERINQALLSSIDQNSSDFKAVSAQIKKEFRLFKEAFDARRLELSAYEQQIAKIVKETGRLGKKLDVLEKNTAASIDKKLDNRLALLKQDLENQIAEVKKRADAANSTAKKAAATAAAAAKAKTASTPEAPPKKSATTTSPTSTPKTQTPDSPFQKAPGAWGISEQDLSQ
jgi:chromosome segregation ATPase